MLVLAVLFPFDATTTMAQATGGLEVRVIDPDGRPLPSATVTLSHVGGNIKPFSVLTDNNGATAFPVLRPGSGYVVEVAMPGFGTRRDADIHIPIAAVEHLVIRLTGNNEERITIIATQPVIDLNQTSSTTKFSDEFAQDLPVASRDYQHLLTLVPGVQDPDGDGNPTVHGSRSRDFKAVISGVSNVDPLTGQFMSMINSDSIEELQVITSGAGVEFGRAQGGFARIVQKQGTNVLEGSFNLLYRSSKLDGTGASDNSNLPDPEFGEIQPSFLLAGPIVKDTLWFRLSHQWTRADVPIDTVGQIVTQSANQGVHADQITWQVSQRNKLALQFQSDPLVIDNLGVSSNTSAGSSQTLDTGSETWALTWTAPLSPRILVQTTLAAQDLESDLDPTQSGLPNKCVVGDSFLSDAQCINFATQEVSGSHFITSQASTTRFSLNSQATIYGGRIWGATHQFKLGLSIENERFFRDLERRPSLGFFVIEPLIESLDTTEDTGFQPDPIFVITATLAVPGESQVEATGTNWSVYFEDQIKPVNNLAITIGGRLDREEIDATGIRPFDPRVEQQRFFELSSDESLPAFAPFRSAFTAYEDLDGFVLELIEQTGMLESEINGALGSVARQSRFWRRKRSRANFNVRNTNISPFLSVSWDPWSTGKNKFAFSTRRYYDKIFLSIPLIELNPATTTLIFDTTPNDDGSVTPNGLSDSFNPALRVETVDRELETPYQDEIRFQYERELWAETLLRVEYINRKYRDQLQSRDVNHLPGDFGRCRITDPLHAEALVPSPGTGTVIDPYTGESYDDTDPGIGDGRDDDCIGRVDTVIVTTEGTTGASTRRTFRLSRSDGITDLYTANPGFGEVLRVGNFNSANYEAFVFEMIRRQYRNWEMQASYTWSTGKGNGEDFQQFFIGTDPSLLDNEFGYQSNDQRHVVKAIATSITPWGFRLGGALTWQSGLPYSVLKQELAFDAVPPAYLNFGSFQPGRVRLTYPTGVRNSERNDSRWQLDMKLTKEMVVGRTAFAQVSVAVFNLLNDGTYSIYNPDLESGRQINGINEARREFGRRWQLGVRFAF